MQEDNNNNEYQETDNLIADQVRAAQESEAEFNNEIAETPKEAASTASAPQPEAEQSNNPPSGWLGTLGQPTATEQPQEPVQPQYKPFNTDEEPKQQATPEQGPSRQQVDKTYRNCHAVESMMNIGTSRLLGVLAASKNFSDYALSDEEVEKAAKALADWNPSFVDKMPDYAAYAMVKVELLTPLIMKAVQERPQNVKYRKAQQAAKKGGDMTDSVTQVVPFNTDGIRTRYDLGSNGYYRYTKKVGEASPDYLKKGNSKAERPDPDNIEEMKHVILKNGGWKKVAQILKLPHEYFITNGINTDNPKLKDED